MNRWKRWKIVITVIGLILIIAIAGTYFTMNYVLNRALNALVEESEIASIMPTPDSVEKTDEDVLSTTVSDEQKPDESTNQQPVKQTSETSEYSGEVSIDKAEKTKRDISVLDKLEVSSVLLGQLSTGDLKLLADLFKGGLSIEEKIEAKKLIINRLSEKEYDDLIDIAKKHGLSQGKTYSDSKATEDLELVAAKKDNTTMVGQPTAPKDSNKDKGKQKQNITAVYAAKLASLKKSCESQSNALLKAMLTEVGKKKSEGSEATLNALEETYLPRIADSEAGCDKAFQQLLANGKSSFAKAGVDGSDVMSDWQVQYTAAKQSARTSALAQLSVALRKNA